MDRRGKIFPPTTARESEATDVRICGVDGRAEAERVVCRAGWQKHACALAAGGSRVVVDGRQCEGGLHLPVTSARHVAGPASARPSTRLTGRQGPRQVRVFMCVRACVCVGSCAFQQTSTANCGEAHLRASPALPRETTPTYHRTRHPPPTTPRPPRGLHASPSLLSSSSHPHNCPATGKSKKNTSRCSQTHSQPASSARKLGPTIALACPRARSLLPPAPTVTSLAPYHNVALPRRAFPARHSKRGRLSATATWLPSPLALTPRRIS